MLATIRRNTVRMTVRMLRFSAKSRSGFSPVGSHRPLAALAAASRPCAGRRETPSTNAVIRDQKRATAKVKGMNFRHATASGFRRFGIFLAFLAAIAAPQVMGSSAGAQVTDEPLDSAIRCVIAVAPDEVDDFLSEFGLDPSAGSSGIPVTAEVAAALCVARPASTSSPLRDDPPEAPTVGVDSAGTSAAVPKRALGLAPGWNTIVYSGDPMTAAELAAQLHGAESLFKWDPVTQEWQSFRAGVPAFLNSLTDVVPGDAIWIKMQRALNIGMISRPLEASVSMAPGWNLVGWLPGQPAGAATTFDQLGTDFTGAYRYDPVTATFESYRPQLPAAFNTLASVDPLDALWVHLESDTTVTWHQLTDGIATSAGAELSTAGHVTIPAYPFFTVPDGCILITAWGSCVDGSGHDSSLEGLWFLTNMTIWTTGGAMDSPGEIGTSLNFSQLLNAGTGQYEMLFSESWDTAAGIEINVLGLTSSCDYSGTSTGSWRRGTYLWVDYTDIVSSVLPADGMLTIANQPNAASHLQVELTDADASIGPIAVTITGADEHGLLQTITETFGWGGTESLTTQEQFSSVTSVTLAGTTGAAGADRIRITTGAVSIIVEDILEMVVEQVPAPDPWQVCTYPSGLVQEGPANVSVLGTGVAESNGFEPDPAIHYSYWISSSWDQLTIWKDHPFSGPPGGVNLVSASWTFSR